MKKRIIVIKKGMEKRELLEALCCAGPLIPLFM